MGVSDTSPRAREVYLRCLAQMTPSERVQIGVDLWETAHRLQTAGLRQLYPDADDEEIIFRIAASRFGLDLASEVYRR